MTWIDITSRSRGEEDAPATTWGLRVPDGSALRVVVTCGHIYYRPDWCMRVYPFDQQPTKCRSTDVEGAQREAVARARVLVETMAADLAEATK